MLETPSLNARCVHRSYIRIHAETPCNAANNTTQENNIPSFISNLASILVLHVHHNPEKSKSHHHYNPLSQPQLRTPTLSCLSSNTIKALKCSMVFIVGSQILIKTALYVVDQVCCAVQIAVVLCVKGTETLYNINVAVAACIENR